jgi:hypothetical protein
MKNSGRIGRLTARIEEIANRLDPTPALAIIWYDYDEDTEAALSRHYAGRPADRGAKATYLVSWLPPTMEESR